MIAAPDPKTVEQWLRLAARWSPMLGGALLGLWIVLLVMLSLFQESETPADAAPASHAPRGAAHRGCVAMPDGVLVCDEAAQAGETP